MPSLLLQPDELEAMTNGLRQPAAQLKELHRQGFVRACRPRNGPVVLYRAHFEAVVAMRAIAGQEQNQPSPQPGPNVVGLQAWARGRKGGNGGQKAQGR